MPTYNRRWALPRALAYFLQQDYPRKELVIVDSGTDSVADLVPERPDIRYHRDSDRIPLGAARNLACELASGSLIAHFDDDDWQAPDRLSRQVGQLTTRAADICGTASVLYYQPTAARAWRFTWPPERHRWLAGQSLCYRRELWSRWPFPAVAAGEDTAFVVTTATRSRAATLDGDLLVAVVHPGNTVPKTDRNVFCAPAALAEVAALLGPDAASLGAEPVSASPPIR
jgi:glycosyltransferase involved in cell wall biosynthesis